MRKYKLHRLLQVIAPERIGLIRRVITRAANIDLYTIGQLAALDAAAAETPELDMMDICAFVLGERLASIDARNHSQPPVSQSMHRKFTKDHLRLLKEMVGTELSRCRRLMQEVRTRIPESDFQLLAPEWNAQMELCEQILTVLHHYPQFSEPRIGQKTGLLQRLNQFFS